MEKTKKAKKPLNKKALFLGSFLIAAVIIASISIFAASSTPNDSLINNSSCKKMSLGTGRVDCFAELFRDAGVKENPAGTNRGAWIDFWNRQAKGSLGDPWCAAFVSYMLRLGHNSWDVNTVSTAKMVELYRAKHQVIEFKAGSGTRVRPGDVLYRTRPTGGHVGIVTSTNSNNGNFYVTEGNTGCSGSSNDCVRSRLYDKNGYCLDVDKPTSEPWLKILRW